MKGDYHRYLAEFATSNDRKEAAENSLVAYKAASDIAMTELPTTHPIRQVVYEVCVFSTREQYIEIVSWCKFEFSKYKIFYRNNLSETHHF